MQLKEKKIVWIDAVRVLACFMVILTHSPQSIEGVNHSLVYATNSFITSPCIPLFFMISGFLLLPMNLPIKTFLKKRLTRILFPMLFFSLFSFILVDVVMNDISLKKALYKLAILPFYRIEGFYWYIYSLAGLYMFAPIISKWLMNSTKKEIQYYLALWSITLIMPYISFFIPGSYHGNGDFYNPLYIFGGFLGYMILGYYLKIHAINLNNKQILLVFIATFLICIIQPLIYILNRNYAIEIPSFNAYLKIDVMMMAVCVFIFLRKINYQKTIALVLSYIAPLTFGMYLVHGFILRYIVAPYIYQTDLPLFFIVLLTAVSTFMISFFIVYLLSKLPFKKYIIG